MDHKNLDVWKKSVDFVTLIYSVTVKFPSEEKFGLVNQLRRAAVSIPSNIAEGSARKNDKEFIQFLFIALGSSAEIETQLIISENLGFIKDKESILDQLSTVRKLLKGTVNYLQNK
ncbi:MAG: four helix bundle protein [Bacteroidales bacterium]|nr:four helix bundle protein [Bacteroidales bacterium]MCF8397557.1 four helix bundle protein [Bacteroidales bacterium]